MGEQTLFIIRHAEKPVEGDPSPGLLPDGTVDPTSLTIRGWQRAGAWAALFGSGLRAEFPSPDVVYAADPTRSPDERPPSKRPWLTVLPLCAKLGRPAVTRWAQTQEHQLAAEIDGLDGVTLVCWEHKLIVTSLVRALLGTRFEGVPTAWHGHRFDVVFKLHRRDHATDWSFVQLMPCFFDGDRADPM